MVDDQVESCLPQCLKPLLFEDTCLHLTTSVIYFIRGLQELFLAARVAFISSSVKFCLSDAHTKAGHNIAHFIVTGENETLPECPACYTDTHLE